MTDENMGFLWLGYLSWTISERDPGLTQQCPPGALALQVKRSGTMVLSTLPSLEKCKSSKQLAVILVGRGVAL